MKDNKLVTTGTVKVDMGTYATVDGWSSVKVLYTYKVVEGNKSAIVYSGKSASSLFQGQVSDHSIITGNYKIGETKTVISQVPLYAKVSSQMKDYSISNSVDLSSNFVEVK